MGFEAAEARSPAPDDRAIDRLVRDAHRDLRSPPFPPRRDLDVALAGVTGPDETVFHDNFRAGREHLAVFVARIAGEAREVGAHALRAFLRAALRAHPPGRALGLGLAGVRRDLPGLAVDAAAATLCTRTGAIELAALGQAAAGRLPGPPAVPGEAEGGDFGWLTVGDAARPEPSSLADADDHVRAALAGRRGAGAAAFRLRRPRPEAWQAFVLPNDVAEIGPLVVEIDDCLSAQGVDVAARAGLDVALDELLTNIVLYAYDDGRAHEVLVDVRTDGTASGGARLRVEIRDDGLPFDPSTVLAPDLASSLDARPLGGLGLHLVRQVFDDVAYARAGGWNVLTLAKGLDGHPGRPSREGVATGAHIA